MLALFSTPDLHIQHILVPIPWQYEHESNVLTQYDNSSSIIINPSRSLCLTWDRKNKNTTCEGNSHVHVRTSLHVHVSTHSSKYSTCTHVTYIEYLKHPYMCIYSNWVTTNYFMLANTYLWHSSRLHSKHNSSYFMTFFFN